MKSIRDRLAVLLMLCLLVWGAVPALAAETVDETRIGSIKVLLCDTETAAPLQGGELTLYRVASVSKNGADMSFTYTNGFENCGIALDNVSESALASRLAEKVTQNAQAVTKTVNDSGIAVFGDLKAGLYLIVQKQAAEGYDAIQPFLVTVPIMENGRYVYDVDAHPKAGTASRKTTQTPPTQEVLSALPQTGQLNWPVPVLAVTGAVLVAAGVVLKKRSGQNENKLGNALIALGVLALLAAVLLMGYNQWDSTRAEKAADSVLTQLEESIAEPRTIYPGDAAEPTADTEMPVGTIDGYDYIGYLSIPSIGLALPVMQQWSYPGLKIAPGRYSGALYTDDLVIAGHNYARHFSPLTHLTVGAEVLFVDMNDNTWHYAVSDTEVLQPTQIEEMAVKTSESNWDLTLFTCTTTGQARYALRCVRTDE